MLVLTRKKGESIRIGEEVELTVLSVQGNRVRLGISAPSHVDVRRSELLSEFDLQVFQLVWETPLEKPIACS